MTPIEVIRADLAAARRIHQTERVAALEWVLERLEVSDAMVGRAVSAYDNHGLGYAYTGAMRAALTAALTGDDK